MCVQTKRATELVYFRLTQPSLSWTVCSEYCVHDDTGPLHSLSICRMSTGHCALHTTLYTMYRLNILFPFVLFRHGAWLHLLSCRDNKNKYKNNYVVYESEQIRVYCLPDGFSEFDWRLDQGGLSAACRNYAITHATICKCTFCASEKWMCYRRDADTRDVSPKSKLATVSAVSRMR